MTLALPLRTYFDKNEWHIRTIRLELAKPSEAVAVPDRDGWVEMGLLHIVRMSEYAREKGGVG